MGSVPVQRVETALRKHLSPITFLPPIHFSVVHDLTMLLLLISLLLVARPWSSAYSVLPRGSVALRSSTMELAPIVTQTEEYFSDFPSLGDLETSFRVEPTDFPGYDDVVVLEEQVATHTSTETIEETAVTSSESIVQLFDDRQSLKETRKKLQEDAPPRRRIHANVRETGYDSIRSYIKTMCNHELLNKNEEVILAREIQILIQWEVGREELESQLLRYERERIVFYRNISYTCYSRILLSYSITIDLRPMPNGQHLFNPT
jgi:hypothetical protein